MITATPNAITHANISATDAFGWVLATVTHDVNVIALALARAERNGVHSLGRAVITHTGYVRDASEFNATTATYRITIGRK